MIHRYGNILRLPNDESSDSRNRDQRPINRPRRIRNRQECNTRDPVREEQCHPRHPSPIHLSQKPRRLPIPRHIQHRPRRHIQRRIPRTQHRNNNHRIDHRRPALIPAAESAIVSGDFAVLDPADNKFGSFQGIRMPMKNIMPT